MFADIDEEVASGVYLDVTGAERDAVTLTIGTGPMHEEPAVAVGLVPFASPAEGVSPHRRAVLAAISPHLRAPTPPSSATGSAASRDPSAASPSLDMPRGRPQRYPDPQMLARAPPAASAPPSHASSSSMSSVDFGLGPCPLPSLIATQNEAATAARAVLDVGAVQPEDEEADPPAHGPQREDDGDDGPWVGRSYMAAQDMRSAQRAQPARRRRAMDGEETGGAGGRRGGSGGAPLRPRNEAGRRALYHHRPPRRPATLSEAPLEERHRDVFASAAATLDSIS